MHAEVPRMMAGKGTEQEAESGFKMWHRGGPHAQLTPARGTKVVGTEMRPTAEQLSSWPVTSRVLVPQGHPAQS